MRLNKRTLAICCVVLLVALAGCTGGPADSGADEDDDDEEAPANETDANESSGGEDVSTDDGMTGQVGGGDTGGMAMAFTDQKRQIVESHAQTLTAAGTYTAIINTSWSGSTGSYSGGQTSGASYALTTTYADPNTGEYYQTFEIPMESMDYTIESYSPAGENVTFTRTSIFGQTSYTRTEQPIDTSQALNPASTNFFEALDFESQGTATRDGETLQRYVVTDVNQIENSAYFDGAVATIDVEVLYNPNRNLLQEISWRYTYQDEDDGEFSSLFTVSYEDIGTTTVSEPGWLSEARQQATSTGSYGNFSSGDFSSGDYNFTAPSG